MGVCFEKRKGRAMRKPKHFCEIVRVLDTYVPDPQIPLQFEDPFSLLVAVILSAQCTDKRVNEVMPALLRRAKTPSEVAAMRVAEITEIIRPCGLYTRKAQAIHDLSEILRDEYGGEVPQTREALERLPCVGRKTASVVLSHAFGVPAFPVDTHILRLSGRWGWSSAKTADGVEKDLCQLFAPEVWLRRHLQLILFGRTWCKATGHNPEACPACVCLLKK